MTRHPNEVPEVPGRSRREIERLADQHLQRYFPDCRHTIKPVPISEFLDYILPDEFGVDFWSSTSLPFGADGRMSPMGRNGRPEIELRESVYLDLLESLPRARFTGGHEGGHGVLHAQYLKTELIEGRMPALYRRQALQRWKDPEWQANVYAGAFLMPTLAVVAFVNRFGVDEDAMGEAFCVSPAAAETRLHYMRREGYAV